VTAVILGMRSAMTTAARIAPQELPMPNPTNENVEQEQQRNIKQGSQGNRQANQQDIESPREEEHVDDIDEDTDEELSTADTDDADISGGEEEIGDVDDEESIERSANESGAGGDNLDQGNQRQAGQRTDDGRRQADDIDIERNDGTRGDDEIEEE
jgi:hypothetical protein